MNKITLNISEECYEDIVRIIESISGKKKAAAFRSLTQRKQEVKDNPTDIRAKNRLKHAETVAGLREIPTLIKNYKMSEKPRVID